MKDGNTDLEKGLVVHIINENDNKHGGDVVWNSSDNSIIYTEGNSQPITHIYISEAGDIHTIRPVDALQLQVKPEIITDTRGTETITYPIVKIGTQYWMRANLKATKYSDGNDINESNDFQNTSAKYTKNGAYYFYNSAAVNTGLISPSGWRVGYASDWLKLQKYVGDKASALKNNAKAWLTPTEAITNYSGFNVVGNGYYKQSSYTSGGKQTGFWKTNDKSPFATNGYILLDANSDEIKSHINSNTIGLCIRCIRE